MENSDEIKCMDCSSENLCYLYGSYVCLGCGLLKTDITTENSVEFNNYEEYKSTYLQKGSKTKVVKNDKYINADIYKLHVQITYSSSERSYAEICTIIDQLDINYKNKTKQLWMDIVETKKIFKGSFRKGMLACCIYYSCIFNNYVIDPEEICKLLTIETKYFNNANKEFIEIFSKKHKELITKTLTIYDYFNRYCYEFELPKEEQFNLLKKCINFFDKLKESKKIPETSLKLLTSSIIYIVSKNIKLALDKNSILKILPYSSKIIKQIEN